MMYQELIDIIGILPQDDYIGFAVVGFIFSFTFIEFFSVLFSSFASWFKK